MNSEEALDVGASQVLIKTDQNEIAKDKAQSELVPNDDISQKEVKASPIIIDLEESDDDSMVSLSYILIIDIT